MRKFLSAGEKPQQSWRGEGLRGVGMVAFKASFGGALVLSK